MKKKAFDIFLGPLARSHIGPWDLHLNKLGKGLLGNDTYYISKHLSQMVLKKKIFRTPGPGPSLTLGPSFEQAWLRSIRRCYIPNSKHLSEAVLDKKIFKYISFLNSRPLPLQGHFKPLGHYLNKLGRVLLGNASYQISRL